tara:strand:- start:1801 stop:2526 length:726 start_codon:yes stop_codon:yes gene_type:complete
VVTCAAKLGLVSFFQMLVREIIRRSPASLVLILWMAAMPLIFSTITGYQSWQHAEWLTGLTQLQWAWFFLLTVFTMAFAFTPTTFVAALSGYFLGFESLWLLVPAYMLASLLGYAVSQLIGAKAVQAVFDAYPRSTAVLDGLKKNDLLLVIMCRISPVLPFAIMNVVLGYTGIRIKPFLLGGLIGMLPRTVMAVAIGMQMEALATGSLFSLLWIGLLVVSFVGLGWVFKRSINRSQSKNGV